MSALTFIAGFVFLVIGAELLVKGASRIALRLGLTPLVVGLTVVALGTSTAELAVGLQAAWQGRGELVIGNVVGSNIANVLLILGVSAPIAPLLVSRRLIRADVPVMIGVSALAFVFGLDGVVGRLEGALLVLGLAVYIGSMVWFARRELPRDVEESGPPPGSLPRDLTLVAVGLCGLMLGADWLVSAASVIARGLGMSELVIGLTVVAVGTSLPELATSLLASLRGQRDLAVGNVIGSNIFNILGVLGASALVAPEGVAVSRAAIRLDFPVMLAVAAACLPLFLGGRIDRWLGLFFLGHYGAYTAFLILDSTQHRGLPVFSAAMLGFVLPLSAVLVSSLGFMAWRRSRRREASEGQA